MKNTSLFFSLLGISFLPITACYTEHKAEKIQSVDFTAEANRIAHETIIIDGHIDVPYRLEENWEDVTQETASGEFDYPRAKKGGLDAPFMSIYTPSEYNGFDTATAFANKLIDHVEKIVASAPEKFVIPHSVGDVEAAFQAGKIALPLGMENGSPINDKIELLDHFFKRGIRYITLTHSESNNIADSSYDKNHQYGEKGISEFGFKVIQRMNELGIIVDISHVSDTAFYSALKASKAPIFASHSSARKFVPGFERDMSDDMIIKLAEKDGVIMINFGSDFILEAANSHYYRQADAYKEYLKTTGKVDSPEVEKEFSKKWKITNPYPFAKLSDVLDHIDHVRNITGSVNHIGIGSDYDGVDDSLPIGLKDVSSYPNLVNGLLKRGYTEVEIKKILSGNVLRVWRAVEKVATIHL